MKKFYAFFAAALLSVSMMAAPAKIPTANDLKGAGYDPSAKVVLCLYFDDEACNDVYIVGNYHADANDDWKLDPAKNILMEELDGFEGWYVGEFEYKEGVMAKPIQMKDGELTWDFQPGDKDAWVNLGVDAATIETENTTQSKVVYPAAGAYIYELKYWQNHKSPCVFIPKYNYTIYLIDPECQDFTPAVVGDFSGWSNYAMSESSISIPGHELDGEFAYVATFTDEADHKIKFREATTTDWSNELQYFKDGGWQNFKDYFLPAVANGLDTAIVFDYGDNDLYRYALCGVKYVTVKINATLPAGAPEKVELMGSFKGGVWNGEGVVMELVDGVYTAEVEGLEDSEYKFRSGVGTDDEKWGNQIMHFDSGEWKTADNFVFGDDMVEEGDYYLIELDLSDAEEWAWTKTVPTGIENVVLTEKAQKVVVDGVVYIIRNNKMFNIHGAQVR